MHRRRIAALAIVVAAAHGCDDDADGRDPDGSDAGRSSAEAGSEGVSQPSAGEGGASAGGSSPMSSAGTSTGPRSPAGCGNGELDDAEECDDGNQRSGDGCSYRCTESCEVCETEVCPMASPSPYARAGVLHYDNVYGMEGTAEAGPAEGTPRVELARNLIECVYAAECTLVYLNDVPITSQISLRDCACANAPADTPPSTYPDVCRSKQAIQPGPCLNEMLAAAETEDIFEMTTRMSNNNFALGAVFNLLFQCDARVCPAECLPKESGIVGSAGSGG